MIDQLRIYDFRNLDQVAIDLAACNLIVGVNGSGKTSLLEAVFLLSRGKSFRHHESKRYISHYKQSCTVWAGAKAKQMTSLAIQKKLDSTNRAETLLRLNEQPVPSQSLLSFHLPTLLIDPAGMSLLDEGSAARRQLLDWLAFHMKPEFYQQWLQHQRLLRQRNGLLKNPSVHQRTAEIAAWDKQLSIYAKALHEHRLSVFDSWFDFFEKMVARLLPTYQNKLHLQYLPGFDTQKDLLEILNSRLKQDIDLGYTRVGAHRADVSVILSSQKQDGQKIRELATHVLSRGEKKLLIIALKLSQLQLICQAMATGEIVLNNPPVVLVDDIDAELDTTAVSVLLDTLLALNCQSIITSLNDEIHHKILGKLNNHTTDNQSKKTDNDLTKNNTLTASNSSNLNKYHLFHVEQGKFSLSHQEPV